MHGIPQAVISRVLRENLPTGQTFVNAIQTAVTAKNNTFLQVLAQHKALALIRQDTWTLDEIADVFTPTKPKSQSLIMQDTGIMDLWERTLMTTCDQEGNTLLHHIIERHSDTAIVRYLLNQTFPLSPFLILRNNKGISALELLATHTLTAPPEFTYPPANMLYRQVVTDVLFRFHGKTLNNPATLLCLEDAYKRAQEQNNLVFISTFKKWCQNVCGTPREDWTKLCRQKGWIEPEQPQNTKRDIDLRGPTTCQQQQHRPSPGVVEVAQQSSSSPVRSKFAWFTTAKDFVHHVHTSHPVAVKCTMSAGIVASVCGLAWRYGSRVIQNVHRSGTIKSVLTSAQKLFSHLWHATV